MTPYRTEKGGPVDTYKRLRSDVTIKAVNAAQRGKPIMYAHYTELGASLDRWFGDVELDDGAYAGAALALSQIAERDCPTLPDHDAARLWTAGSYARRVLKAWGAGDGGPVSLKWLRDRAGVSA